MWFGRGLSGCFDEDMLDLVHTHKGGRKTGLRFAMNRNTEELHAKDIQNTGRQGMHVGTPLAMSDMMNFPHLCPITYFYLANLDESHHDGGRAPVSNTDTGQTPTNPYPQPKKTPRLPYAS